MTEEDEQRTNERRTKDERRTKEIVVSNFLCLVLAVNKVLAVQLSVSNHVPEFAVYDSALECAEYNS